MDEKEVACCCLFRKVVHDRLWKVVRDRLQKVVHNTLQEIVLYVTLHANRSLCTSIKRNLNHCVRIFFPPAFDLYHQCFVLSRKRVTEMLQLHSLVLQWWAMADG